MYILINQEIQLSSIYRTLKIKPVDVKSKTDLNVSIENNYKKPNFRIGNYVRITFQIDRIKVFVTKIVKNTVPWAQLIKDLNWGETVGTFYERELQKTNQKEIRLEKVINPLVPGVH